MSLQFTILFNLSLCGLNLYLLWKLIQFKKYLFNLNQVLLQINYDLPLILKEIPLAILLTALEIKKFKSNYNLLKLKIKNTQKLIIIIKFIYRLTQGKLR
ncbi:hypothetical protein [Geminocystis herdmanii]|uniref:hypothetical protein n=1 Tax=Geminocystis herdmanii TaxID=669359 RepID=UPI0003604583|nr:hypothetical protein [Geminocystis herdmanii]